MPCQQVTIRSFVKTCQCLLSLLGMCNLFNSFSFAMDSAPSSESSFGYFLTEDGMRGKLHDPSYSQEEIAIVDHYIELLSLPRSREKDELIAKELAKQVRHRHAQLFSTDIGNSCWFLPTSSFPETNNLKEIVLHGLHGRKFLWFGRNRTFKTFIELNWVDSDNNVTPHCPSILANIWQEARRADRH